MKPPKIRPALPGDLGAVTQMIAALADHHGDTADITPTTLSRDVFGTPGWLTLLVAEAADGTLVGYAALQPKYRLQFGQRGLDLHHLFVHADWRGQGLGKRLIDASLTQARNLGCKALTVGTDPDNHAAQTIYKHLGFAHIPQSDNRFAYTIA